MNRRNILWSAVSGLGAALGASSAKAATEAGTGNKLKVVYHLSDAEKVNFESSATSRTTSMASAAPTM
ncbi:hypothetical protein ACVWZK_003252 [Bradyrhizobium sp. GM0.4]